MSDYQWRGFVVNNILPLILIMIVNQKKVRALYDVSGKGNTAWLKLDVKFKIPESTRGVFCRVTQDTRNYEDRRTQFYSAIQISLKVPKVNVLI